MYIVRQGDGYTGGGNTVLLAQVSSLVFREQIDAPDAKLSPVVWK